MRRAARALVPKALYSRADLAAGAQALAGRGEAALYSDGTRWRVEVSGKGAEALLGELLNEALSHSWRQARLKDAGPAARALASRLLTEGFPASPEDPLEMLEPQVREDRREDVAALLARAKGGA